LSHSNLYHGYSLTYETTDNEPFFLLISDLCSFNCVPKRLFVCPTYVVSQFKQFTLYTQSFCDIELILSLPLLINLFRVFGTEQAISKPYFFVIGKKLSEINLTYGIVKKIFLLLKNDRYWSLLSSLLLTIVVFFSLSSLNKRHLFSSLNKRHWCVMII